MNGSERILQNLPLRTSAARTLAGTFLAHRLPMVQPAGRSPGQDIRDRTFQFACDVVRLCQILNESGGIGRAMAPQLLNAATSTAAMLEEARGAESRRDFSSKCSIALKEMREVHVRLRVLERCQIGPRDQAARLRAESDQLVSILTAIVRKARVNQRS